MGGESTYTVVGRYLHGGGWRYLHDGGWRYVWFISHYVPARMDGLIAAFHTLDRVERVLYADLPLPDRLGPNPNPATKIKQPFSDEIYFVTCLILLWSLTVSKKCKQSVFVSTLGRPDQLIKPCGNLGQYLGH